jgi:ribosomal protein S18 acetylase RimI-like enzyme
MELEKDYIIRLISDGDNVKKFSAGDKNYLPLKTFLQKQAVDFQKALVAQTYVAALLTGKIIGYITLTCSEIDLRNGYDVNDCPKANEYDSLPALKIARLAVDSKFRGEGIGQALVDTAISITVTYISPQVGCRFLITDSKKQAVGFYEKYGFTFLDTDDNRVNDNPVMFIDLTKL